LINRTNARLLIYKPYTTATRSSILTRASRKQPFLVFDAQARVDTFKHHASGDLGEFFRLDFVEASAANAVQRSTTTPDSFHGRTPKKPLQRPATTSQ